MAARDMATGADQGQDTNHGRDLLLADRKIAFNTGEIYL